MGHYASEMNGGPFSSSVTIKGNVASGFGKKILKSKKILPKKVLSIEIAWINPYSFTRMIWLKIHYVSKKIHQSIKIDEFEQMISKADRTERNLITNKLALKKVSI